MALTRSEKLALKARLTDDKEALIELEPRQLLAAEYVAQDLMTKDEIASAIGIHTSTLKKWTRIPIFKRVVERKENQYEKIDPDARTKVYKGILKPILTELQKRTSAGGLDNLKITTLARLATTVGNELRLDDEDSVTSKIGHTDLTPDLSELQNRFSQLNNRKHKKLRAVALTSIRKKIRRISK